MPQNDVYDELALFPPTPGAERELNIRLTRERTQQGHLLWMYAIAAHCDTCGPVALAAGPFPPFAGATTRSTALHRLTALWFTDAPDRHCHSGDEGQGRHENLLEPFHQHLELRHSLE